MISPRILFLQGMLTSGRLFRLSICLLFWKSTDVIENVFKFNFQALASKFHHTACHGCCLQREVGSRGEGGEIFGIIQDLDLDSKCANLFSTLKVRKQWKELVLAGSHVPSQFTGVRRCKWAKCR